jgi:hypothetical protein
MTRNAPITTLALVAIAFSTPARAAETTFDTILKDYETVRQALVKDDAAPVKPRAEAIQAAARTAAGSFDAAAAGVPADRRADALAVLGDIAAKAEALAKAAGIDAARDAFYPLSQALVRYRAMAVGAKPAVAYCSMANKSWLQPDEKMGNPYFGSQMAMCGEVVEKAQPAR